VLTIDSQNNALRVPLRTDGQGVIRVGETLVSILTEFKRGATPEQIVQDFDAVSLHDVYAVVAYYLQTQTEVDAFLEEHSKENERIHRDAEVRFPQAGIRERLLQRKAAHEGTA
jgi:uncharacterized protein (DUF433 family)